MTMHETGEGISPRDRLAWALTRVLDAARRAARCQSPDEMRLWTRALGARVAEYDRAKELLDHTGRRA